MEYPNTAYKPGEAVWYVHPKTKEVRLDRVHAVLWMEEEIVYELAEIIVKGGFDGDELFSTKELALLAAEGKM